MPRLPNLRPCRILAAALLLISLAGCATETLYAVDEGGQSLWQRVETEHFVVESNIPRSSKVHGIASDFETLWHAFASVPVLGLRPPDRKPLVVLLRNESEYRYLAGSGTSGLFFRDSPLGPVILMPPSSGAFKDITVKQELAHFIASDFLRTAPEWVTTGLAQVMETASYDTDEGEILFGGFLQGRVDWASMKLPAEVFMGQWPRDMTSLDAPKFYARSWLLVHYLIDYHLQEFLDFLVRVSGGKAWREAWANEISLPFGAIDDALSRYHQRAKYGLWKVKAKLPDMADFVDSVAPVADVLALRALLQAGAIHPARQRPEKQAAARRDLDAALALDPENARARSIRAASADADS